MKPNLPSGLNERRLPHTLSPDAFYRLVTQGVVVDGRAGGLILGRSYGEGGIFIVHQRGEHYFIHGVTEGGEFVVNKDASCKNLRRLSDMNLGKTADEPSIDEGEMAVARVVVTHAEPDDKLLWLCWHQMVVAAEPVGRHIAELVKLNEWENPYTTCNFNDVFPPADRSADGIV